MTLVGAARRIAGSSRFEIVTLGVILANALVLGLETYRKLDREYGSMFETLNVVFVAYFVVEIATRVAAHGARPQDYFRSGWNAFDFFVVAAVFVPGVAASATLLRVVRLLRVFRVVSVLPEMRILIRGIVRALAPLGSMAVLTLLLFYVYAMLGWIFFDDHDPEHWRSVGQAMLTLFSVVTLEGWVEVQETALRASDWAWVYFVSFVVISSFILINMVIAIVISSVDEARAAVAAEDRRLARQQIAAEHVHHAAVLDRLDALRQSFDALEEELEGQRQEALRLREAAEAAPT